MKLNAVTFRMKAAVALCAALAAPALTGNASFSGITCTVHAAEEGKRIAVVNVARVFSAYQRVKDVQKKMQVQFEPENKALEKDYRELKTREDQLKLDSRPQDDPQFFKDTQDFQSKKFDWQRRMKKLDADVEEARKNEMKGVLNDIKEAIRSAGQTEKFDLVLRAPEFDDEFDPNKANKDENREEPKSAAELVRRFRENPVLYFSQGVDITDKVISGLNGKYKPDGK